ncbi:MAG: type II secretion system F family protein [Pseudomonadota bacterium]
MSNQQIIFLIVVFAVAFCIVLLAMYLFSPDRVQQRLTEFTAVKESTLPSQDNEWVEKIVKVAKPFAKLSLPEEGWEKSALRTRFINAGWRSPSAPAIYFAAKTILAIALPMLLTIVLTQSTAVIGRYSQLFMLLLCATIGYYLPNVLLSQVVKRRQREIFENFPDALDLLTVCVEAGLSLEQALNKVASEMQLKSLVLSHELELVLIEMRAGFSKEKALRNLALRTGVEDIDTLVAMLIQSERFGTSMGDSLRVHSESLRSKRRFRAEEAAAKIALKLLFPLIFFIFPTLLLVLLGPAFIQIYRVLLPTFAGTN